MKQIASGEKTIESHKKPQENHNCCDFRTGGKQKTGAYVINNWCSQLFRFLLFFGVSITFPWDKTELILWPSRPIGKLRSTSLWTWVCDSLPIGTNWAESNLLFPSAKWNGIKLERQKLKLEISSRKLLPFFITNSKFNKRLHITSN